MELSQHAAQQGGVFTLAQALAHTPRAEVRRNVRAGCWIALRRGIYAERAVVLAASEDPRAQHMLECAASVLASAADVVVSHESAAIAQELPLMAGYTGPPRLTLPRPASTAPLHVNGLLTAHLPAAHRTSSQVPLTIAARTVADLARGLPREDALGMLDAALRRGGSRDDVQEVLGACTGWPGVKQARELLALAHPKAESMLESLGRLWCHDAGLPPPELQLWLFQLPSGAFVARSDLVWVEQRTVGELDGRMKYSADDEERPGRVLWEEKLREDLIRDHGFEVARGYGKDRAQNGQPFVERVRRAMVRGTARLDAPTLRFGRD